MKKEHAADSMNPMISFKPHHIGIACKQRVLCNICLHATFLMKGWTPPPAAVFFFFIFHLQHELLYFSSGSSPKLAPHRNLLCLNPLIRSLPYSSFCTAHAFRQLPGATNFSPIPAETP
jgi:hypothetical protein